MYLHKSFTSNYYFFFLKPLVLLLPDEGWLPVIIITADWYEILRVNNTVVFYRFDVITTQMIIVNSYGRERFLLHAWSVNETSLYITIMYNILILCVVYRVLFT